MGLSLKKIGKSISSVVGGVEHAVTHNAVTNTIGNVEKAAIHTAAQIPHYANPVNQIRGVGQVVGRTAPHIPTFSASSPLRFANNAIINPAKTTGVHIGQAANGVNPYHGTVGQQVGQGLQDAITLSTALPIGKGAQLATQGGRVLPRVVSGAKVGFKVGSGFGAAQGTSTALKDKQTFPQAAKTIATNTVVGGAGGAALGAAVPVAGAGAKLVNKYADNRGLAVGASVKKAKPEDVLKHFTDPEVAKQLQAGAKFDYTKDPIHGTGNLAAGKTTGKFVNDGKPALYLSKNDKAWSVANIPKPNPEKVNIDHVTPEMMQAGYFQKNGITPVMDYATQKWVGYRDAFDTKKLQGVDYHVSPDAKRLTIDSAKKLREVVNGLGVSPDEPQFWSSLRNQYDVVDITNVDKNRAVEGYGRKFFQAAKADQSIVLNPEKASVRGRTGSSSRGPTAGLPVQQKRNTSVPPTPASKPTVSLKQPDNVSPEEVAKYSQAFNTTPAKAAAELSKLKQAESVTSTKQMRKPQGVGVPQATKDQLNPKAPKVQFRREQKTNTQLNPLKVDVPEVRPGDYAQARLHPKAVESPIKFSAAQTINKVKKLSAEDKANFWKAVENPDSITSPALKEAVSRWNDLANRVHATSQALGGNTNYVVNYARHNWDLTDPKMAAKYEALVNSRGGQAVDPYAFGGVNNQNRAFKSITEGEAAGFKQKNPGNPAQDVADYADSVAGSLRKQALAKAFTEADMNQPLKNHSFDLGNGQTIPISEQGLKEMRAFDTQYKPSTNRVVKAIRTANVAAKTLILSGGQFHTVNIGLLRAIPTLIARGHFTQAGHAFYDLLRGSFSKEYADAVLGAALKDGMVEKAAKIGAPYGQAGYNVEGTSLKSGVGHKLVFERQIPMVHNQVVRAVIRDLEKRGVALDSEEARQAGIAANSTMGFLNKEALNMSPRVRQLMSDFMLAGQFTPSKVLTVSKVAKGGVAGKYARADIVSNAAAATTLVTGVGYLLGQKSDSIRDSMLRALINPAVPTPQKDKKGNNIELRIPLTYTGEISKIIGLKLKRGADGHLGVDWNPGDALSAHSGLMEWMRSRLAPVPSTLVKLKTNTNFADKPLSDPNAPAGTRAIQDATTIGQGLLPIGLQGVPNTKVVKDHVPGSVKEILEANTPGSNPALKGAFSSIGFSPRTDQTVGKGLETSRYFSAVDASAKGLDRQSKDAYDMWTGSKKNPVTGKYDVKPSVYDASTKANALLQSPKAFDAVYKLNQRLAKEGEKVDPLWQQSKDNIRKYLDYQHMPPGSADKTNWYHKNGSWYGPLVDQRNAFFDSLPAGDPNKPKLDLQFPEASQSVSGLMTQYSTITDSKQKGAFLDAHPDVIQQWNKQSAYTNKLREALGYSPLKNYPEPTKQLQGFIDRYSGSDKATKKGIRSANPQQYQNMIAYFDSLDLYNINKEGAVNQLQGEPDQTSKQNKAISNLAKDIYQNPDGTYSIIPAGWMQGLSNGSGGFGFGSGKSSTPNPYKYALSLDAGGKAARPKVSVRQTAAPKTRLGKTAKPKVTLKKSKV